MSSSNYEWSKIVLMLVLLCSAASNCMDAGFAVSGQIKVEKPAAPNALKITEIIKDTDLRYLATLGAGAGLTAAGIAVLLKSCWASKNVDDYKKASTLEEWERLRYHYGEDNIRGGSGFFYICTGLFIIANAKNIPAFYDRVGEWLGTGLQRFLNTYSVVNVLSNGAKDVPKFDI